MHAIIKFKELEDVTKFDQVVASFAGWDLKAPLNSDVGRYIRVLTFNGTKDNKAFYEYLRDLGAFEEVVLR